MRVATEEEIKNGKVKLFYYASAMNKYCECRIVEPLTNNRYVIKSELTGHLHIVNASNLHVGKTYEVRVTIPYADLESAEKYVNTYKALKEFFPIRVEPKIEIVEV